jgi:hypothetical protein
MLQRRTGKLLGEERMMRSKYGMIGAVIYLLIAGCTYAFWMSDQSMYSAAIFVLQGWPWVSFLPILLAILLNAVIIYFILAGLERLLASRRHT